MSTPPRNLAAVLVPVEDVLLHEQVLYRGGWRDVVSRLVEDHGVTLVLTGGRRNAGTLRLYRRWGDLVSVGR